MKEFWTDGFYTILWIIVFILLFSLLINPILFNKSWEKIKDKISKGLKKTTMLNIDSVKPNEETIFAGTQPVTIKVSAKTSGGIDGKAKCSYGSGGQFTSQLVFFGLANKVKTSAFWQTIADDPQGTLLSSGTGGGSNAAAARAHINMMRNA